MGWNSVETLAEVQDRMDAEQYVDVLEENLLPNIQESGISKEEVIFKQDNDTSTPPKKLPNGSNPRISMFWTSQTGLHPL